MVFNGRFTEWFFRVLYVREKIVGAPCTLYSSLIIVKSLQLHGRKQIAEPLKYCLVRVIVFFSVCFLYLFCFSQVGILVKFPTTGIRA